MVTTADCFSNDPAAGTVGVCEACEDTALYYCVTCPKLLCERCAQIHSVSGQRKNHKVVFLKDYPRQVAPPNELGLVNYDIPEHVYLPRKRHSDPPEQDCELSHQRARGDKNNKEGAAPKKAQVKKFAYSKSVSSRASSVAEDMDISSTKSYRSEKSVGTDVAGKASMIKNNNFTIMVYSNNSDGSSQGEEKRAYIIKNTSPDREKPSTCCSCSTKSENGEYHDHGVYIARKASMSSTSTCSFTSHACDSHLSEFERSQREKSRGRSFVSNETLDSVSDIVNKSRDASPKPIFTSSPIFPEEDEIPTVSENVLPTVNQTPNMEKTKKGSSTNSVSSKSSSSPSSASGKENRRPSSSSRSSNPVVDKLLDKYEPHEEPLRFRKSSDSTSSTSSSSNHSTDSTSSSSDRSSHSEHGNPPKNDERKVSGDDESHEDDQRDEEANQGTDVQSGSEAELKADESNISLPFAKHDEEPCMIPQRPADITREHNSPLIERVRKQSIPDDYIDENLYNEPEEVYEGNDSYLTHSSHISSCDENDKLSEIIEEPSLEISNTSLDPKVESVTQVHEIIEEVPFTEDDDENIEDDDEEEMVFDIQSITSNESECSEYMVTKEVFSERYVLPDLPDTPQVDDDRVSVYSQKSLKSTSSSVKRFAYAKSESSAKLSRASSVKSIDSEKSVELTKLKITNATLEKSKSIESLNSNSSKGSLEGNMIPDFVSGSSESLISGKDSVRSSQSSRSSKSDKNSLSSKISHSSNSSRSRNSRTHSSSSSSTISDGSKEESVGRSIPIDNLPHNKKHVSDSSSSSDESYPLVNEEVIGIDYSEKPGDRLPSRPSSQASEGSKKSDQEQRISFDSDPDCNGSFISDSSVLRKPVTEPETLSESEQQLIREQMKNFIRVEDISFMDSTSTNVTVGPVQEMQLLRAEMSSDQSDANDEQKPLNISSVEAHRAKFVIIAKEGEEPPEEIDGDTLYFPSIEEYRKWTKNQKYARDFSDTESEKELCDEAEFLAGEDIEQEILYNYAKFKEQQSLSNNKDFPEKNLEDILKIEEMSIASSKESEGGSIMDVISADNISLSSSSTSTIVDEDCEQLESAPQQITQSQHPPVYFDEEKQVNADNKPIFADKDTANPLYKVDSQISISSSIYSAASKDYFGHYVNKFNNSLEHEPQPADYEDDNERFSRKYSKRVSALTNRNAQTMPRNMGGNYKNDSVTQTYTLPRKKVQDQGTFTNFLNQTYAGRGSSKSENVLYSRSFGSLFPDSSKFPGADNTRSLPRHLGRKPYLRCPSMKQVDWSVMGRKGTEPGFLMNPTGIAVDEHCVAICEEGNTRVQIFIEDESAYCINNLQNPCGIALSHENIFVTDIDTNVVKVYGRNALEKVEMGEKGSQRGQFNEPRGVSFNPINGHLAVCDTENNRVQIFDYNLGLLKILGSKGKGKGEFREPISCTYDRWGRLLVSDHCNYRVQIFDDHYRYITEFGKYGKGSGEFWGVNGICSHSNGDILVVDSDNNCLSVHSSDGRFISVFGRKGDDRWEFLYPHSVSSDEVGNVYVSDWGNHRIHIMDKKLLPYLELESHML